MPRTPRTTTHAARTAKPASSSGSRRGLTKPSAGRSQAAPATGRNVGFWQKAFGGFTAWTVRTKFWKRLALGIIAVILLAVGSMYGVAQWYIHEHAGEPTTVGVTFIPDYARYYGLDARQTYTAILEDLNVKQVRLTSYWDSMEPEQGTFNFSELDWEMQMAQDHGVKVSLSLGLRQPRWPECHMPGWASKMQGENAASEQWKPALMDFITQVVNRYKNSPALDSYQLENEYFLKAFGQCTDFNRQRLVDEFNLVKSLDPDHTLVVSMSNNAIGTPVGDPKPDEYAISIYKRVWDKTITKRYFEYPIPAWYYAFRAGFVELTTGRNSFIHELQAEAWTPDPFGGTLTTPLAEQDKSMNPTILTNRIKYGEATGMKTLDLWGVEWWYWRKVKFNDPGLWDAARAGIAASQQANLELLQKKQP